VTRLRWIPLLAGALLALSAASPALADDPHVQIVSKSPLPPQVGAARGVGQFNAVTDSEFPAGTPFVLDMPLPGKSPVAAMLHIWPNAERECKNGAPAAASPMRQYYRLGMSASGVDKDRVFSARVPALQVDQYFCFAVDLSMSLADDDFKEIARSAADRLKNSSQCYTTDKSLPLFEAALQGALRQKGITAQPEPAADHALAQYRLAQGPKKCGDVLASDVKIEEIGNEVRARDAKLTKSLAAVKALPQPPGGLAPVVFVQGGLVPVSKLLAAGTADDTLAEAIRQLRLREAGGPPDEAFPQWAAALETFRGELARSSAMIDKWNAVDAAKKAATSLPKVPAIDIWDDQALVPIRDCQQRPEAIGPSKIVVQLERLTPDLDPGPRKIADEWIRALKALRDARETLKTVTDDLDKETTLLAERKAGFQKVLQEAWSAERVQAALVVEIQATDLGRKAGFGKTPAAANYASVDAGVLVGFPSGGQHVEPWVTPYLGFNFYLVPVDRSIPMGELTGSGWGKVAQRVAITLGTTLIAPSITGRTVKPAFVPGPLAALGVRLTHYVRLTGGGILYKLADKNPASAKETFYVAPFGGLSADIDLVHILTNQRL
jgi:hypothetical protein